MSADLARLASALSDRYRIERELGAGGMATVYLAHDVRHDRKVAVKVLRPELAAVIGAERFLSEIKTTANLQHPHILPLFDSGVAESFLFYVMPFIDGESLRDRLTREKQLPVAEAVRIATEVASALDYAHRHGVIHRDIKPENILLHDGSALVADFGIALAASKVGGTRMTETGMSLGTPQYMSPEQAMGERDLDARTDVYAVGVVTYEMLVGEPPFTGPTAQAIVAKVMTEHPKGLTVQRRSVPPNVDAAVLVALEKLPADRFAGTDAFARALADEQFTGSRAAPGSMTAPAGFWKPLSIAALIATAALTFVLVRRDRAVAWSAGDFSWRLALTFGDSARPLGPVVLSPDGSSVVYTAVGPHGTQLWLRDAGALAPIPIPGTNFAPSDAAFSADGRRIAFSSDMDDSIRIAGRDGVAPPVTVAFLSPVFGLAWSDNNHLLAGTHLGLMRIAVNGGPPERVTTVDTARNEALHSYPDLLPGGRGVVFGVSPRDRTKDQGWRIAVADLATGRHTILLPGYRVRYAPPGYLLVLQTDGTLVAVPFDAAGLRVTGAPVTLLGGLAAAGFWFASAPTGRLIYPTGSTSMLSQLVRIGPQGSTVVDSAWSATSITLSADGRRLATTVGGGADIMVLVRDLQSGSTTTIHAAGVPEDPVFSADGRTVVFNVAAPHGGGVFRATPGSIAPAERVDESVLSELASSSDGRTLYYTRASPPTGRREIFAHSLDGGSAPDRLIAATSANLSNPMPSPDGRWLAYLSDESDGEQLYVRSVDPANTQQWRVSRGGATGARWSRDGHDLFYTTNFHAGGDSMIAAEIAPGGTFTVVHQRALFSTEHEATGRVTSWDVLPTNGEFFMLRDAGPIGADHNQVVMLEQWQALLHREGGSHE